MKLRGLTRTSLFARMSLLFGLLVTVPLVISGIVLSFSGWRSVTYSGEVVARIGSEAVDKTADRFNEVAREKLEEAATNVVVMGRTRVDETTQKATEIGKQALEKNTEELSDRGREAVDEATKRMMAVSEGRMRSSLAELDKINQESLRLLNDRFNTLVNEELEQSAEALRTNLEGSLGLLWETSADRRALSIEDYLQRQISNMMLRLQIPIQHPAFTRFQEDYARGAIDRFIRRDAHPEVVRVVLVSATGSEWLRMPETDLEPGEEGEDWTNSRTRRELFRRRDSPMVLVEPLWFDEKRSNRWILRLAHKTLPGLGDETPPPERMGPAERPGPAVQPVPFVIIDFAMDNVVVQATAEASPSMQVLVIHPATGRVISSRDPSQKNARAQRISDQLPTGNGWQEYESKAYQFRYETQDGVAMRASARPWRLSRTWSPADVCWTVVAQPESEVLLPVNQLEDDIRGAWARALASVQSGGEEFIQARNVNAANTLRELLAGAQEEMGVAGGRLAQEVEKELLRDQETLARELDRQLQEQVATLGQESQDQMQHQAQALATSAFQQVRNAAGLETASARDEIAARANHVANRAAAQMLLNSAWMTPLFLVLALFLATLTARSLVRPINELLRGTQALAAGEYNRRIKVRGDDELARLALAFNDMASAIERGQAELQQSHDSLAAEKARIEGIVTSSPDGLVMLGPAGEAVFINPAAMRLLEIPATAVARAPLDLRQLPAPAGERLRRCLELAGTGDEPQEYEIGDKQRRVLQLREVQLVSAEGRSYGQLLHLHDITRERIIDEMKSDFISLVSHELRTPLTSILGFSSYLLTGRLGEIQEAQRTALDSIHRQAKRLSAIISDFLDISRIESGKIEMKKDEIAIDQVARRVVEDLRPQAVEKQVEVETELATAGPFVALADEQRVAQVFTNLIGNALKFTDEGSVRVHLREQNGEIRCSVRDTGCGIPRDELDRVFDRFYQVEKVVTRKSGGTGLGLAIVKNIVEAHGGRIWIDSAVGEGTEVSFTLPRPT